MSHAMISNWILFPFDFKSHAQNLTDRDEVNYIHFKAFPMAL